VKVARVVLTGEGPLLVSGPVDLELPDGTRVRSRRPVTAVCTCRRSGRYPFCDASHRTAPDLPDGGKP
jgi:CDGSH-type Zn-finger protein